MILPGGRESQTWGPSCALWEPWDPITQPLCPVPPQMKEERFRQLFAAFGSVTDCSLKFTKDGKFRKFGFIGFKLEEEAAAALSHFHRTFIDTSRVTVNLPATCLLSP